MRGQMELECSGRALTLNRSTLRADAPLGSFSCTYTGTNTPAPDVTSLNCGETLLGVPLSVYRRCAFISSGKLAVDGDPELERRITSLISTGEEQISFSDVEQTLKKQLRIRQYNRSGTIPHLLSEIASLEETRRSACEISQQIETVSAQLEDAQQLRQQAHQQALQSSEKLQQRWQLLPDSRQLQEIDEQMGAVKAAAEHARQARDTCSRQEATVENLERELCENPLYPITKQELDLQLQHAVASPPSPAQLLIPLALGLFGAGILWYCIDHAPLYLLCLSCAWVALAAGSFVWLTVRRIQARKRLRREKARQDGLERLADSYIPMLDTLEEHRALLRRYRCTAEESESRLRSLLSRLLTQVRTLDPTVSSLSDIRRFLQQVTAERADLTAQMQRAQAEALQNKSSDWAHDARIPALQRQLAQLQGQLASIGSITELSAQLAQKRQLLQSQQEESDALQLALTALQKANTDLQSRFSPELGRRAAEIFAQMTDAQWDKILLDRDFQLFVASNDDTVRRSAQLLSSGTADQLYLATRLAICEFVLPEDTNPPLILDDALLTFDDARLQKTLDFLANLGKSRQILLFTCQGREAAYFSGRKNVHIVAIG